MYGNLMIRRFKSSSSSKRWLERQMNDKFTKRSKESNYKSRAAFKIMEIHKRFHIFNKSTTNILDLGYAPGSWSQVAIQEMNKTGTTPRILGIDLIRCAPPKGVSFLQGDFLQLEVQNKIIEHFEGEGVNLIMSDMMVNTMGNKDADHLGSLDLCESVLSLSDKILAKNGSLVMKFFMGREQVAIEAILEKTFKKLYKVKPESSRDQLREIFLVALKKKSMSGKTI